MTRHHVTRPRSRARHGIRRGRAERVRLDVEGPGRRRRSNFAGRRGGCRPHRRTTTTCACRPKRRSRARSRRAARSASPACRIIPGRSSRTRTRRKAGSSAPAIAGLVVLRPVKTDTEKVYSSALWVSGYYNYAWDYWGYGWATRRSRSARAATSGRSPSKRCSSICRRARRSGPRVTRTTDPRHPRATSKLTGDRRRQAAREEGLVARPRARLERISQTANTTGDSAERARATRANRTGRAGEAASETKLAKSEGRSPSVWIDVSAQGRRARAHAACLALLLALRFREQQLVGHVVAVDVAHVGDRLAADALGRRSARRCRTRRWDRARACAASCRSCRTASGPGVVATQT